MQVGPSRITDDGLSPGDLETEAAGALEHWMLPQQQKRKQFKRGRNHKVKRKHKGKGKSKSKPKEAAGTDEETAEVQEDADHEEYGHDSPGAVGQSAEATPLSTVDNPASNSGSDASGSGSRNVSDFPPSSGSVSGPRFGSGSESSSSSNSRVSSPLPSWIPRLSCSTRFDSIDIFTANISSSDLPDLASPTAVFRVLETPGFVARLAILRKIGVGLPPGTISRETYAPLCAYVDYVGGGQD